MPGRVIAIDGPAASGKSSVAREVASALGWLFVSSGHFYRAVAWGVVRDGIPDASAGAWISGRELDLSEDGTSARLRLDGEDVTPRLSLPEVAGKVSVIAADPVVRDFINVRLRALACRHDAVMEGRDIGSVVFPETPWKFYLDASPEVRARRRAGEGSVDSVSDRDRLDSSRAAAPLTVPVGAVVIDTTLLDLGQVIAAVLSHIGNPAGMKP